MDSHESFAHDDEEYDSFYGPSWARMLAAPTDGPTRIDYSVLSVAVATLGLIMMVEVGRHRLDHAAGGRPFFKAVLEGVYAELATLGMVEFFIWILHNYYENLNIAKEQVFAKVHFTLFYTAILNAFQSVILAFFSSRLSQKIWVETEALELNHYVEIREEFERVSAELRALKHSNGKKADDSSATNSDDIDGDDKKKSQSRWTGESEFVFEFSVRGVKKLFSRLQDRIRYPQIKRKHDKLLIQVRFHELRVHFLQAYKLPWKLRISDYLIRSEQQVLIKLVHVSTVAWLLLTAAMNILYVVLGFVAYNTEDGEVVGATLTWVFFSCLLVFLVSSVLVYNKMKGIFKTIMNKKTLWDIQSDLEIKEELADEQLGLFWGGDPKLVIAAIQFMQFGFALALSVVLIFWEQMNDGGVPMEAFVFTIFGCYALFVYVMAQVIPRYTLCTSLGQLVNQKRLNETVALFHLEEAKRQRLEQIEIEGYEDLDDVDMGISNRTVAAEPEPDHPLIGGLKSVVSTVTRGGRPPNRLASTASKDTSEPEVVVDSAALMAELVKLDTDALRTNLPLSEREELSKREMERANRKARRKSTSDGVTAMAAMGKHISAAAFATFGTGPSAGSRRTLDDFAVPNKEPAPLEAKEGISSSAPGVPLDPKAERMARRRRRKKSASDGVFEMSMASSERFDPRGLVPFAPITEGVPVESEGVEESESTAQPVVIVEAPSDELARGGGGYDDEDDDDDSTGSIDGHSDTDDVPGIDPSFIERPEVVNLPRPTIREKFRKYYASQRFPVISRIFGTLVAFFLVGQRVERFLHTEGIVSNDFISFDFNNVITFWMFSAWMLLFLCTTATTLWAFQPWEVLQNNVERARVVAAIMDGILATFCLTMFMVAESKRCCYPEDSLERFLAATDDGDEPAYFPEPTPCGCPAFGSRAYGGLGNIEPYIALICLRVFRHWAAKRYVNYWTQKERWAADSRRDNMSLATDPFDVYGEGDHMESDLGTISELWEVAVGKYPNIVAKHGEFSGELLQAMLGLLVIEAPDENDVEDSPDETAVVKAKQSFVAPQQYSSLPVETQEIIMAGRLGKRVKSVHNFAVLNSEDPAMQRVPTEPGNLHFHVDTSEPTDTTETNAMFNAPNARLVRSMRRCDRKLLPMLDTWTKVDVVMTRFEMVYFEVTDDFTQEETTENTRQALTATKGGKGLRLCDVAAGRRVVGHLQFSDVRTAHVEREMPGGAEDENDADDMLVHTEYWQSNDKHVVHSSHWKNIVQDRLSMHTVHGRQFYLRFYADLEDAESHTHALELGDAELIIKNNSFQWAQTIVRYCGPEQLTQQLPHFGDDNDDELRDYLVLNQESDSKHGHRRTASNGEPVSRRNITRRISQIGMLARPGFIRRASTIGTAADAAAVVAMMDEETGMAAPSHSHSHPLSLNRSSSVGEAANEQRSRPFKTSKKGSVSFSDEAGVNTETTPDVDVDVLKEIEEDEAFFGKPA